jgi:hypothetical protein
MILNDKLLKVVFLFVFSASTFAYSQNSKNDSLFKAIASYQDTTSQLIGKARSMLVSKFGDQDLKAIADLKNFLQSAENKDYISLYPFERWLLDYNIDEFGDLLQTTLQFDSAYYSSFKYRVRPQYDLLEKKLIDFSVENRSKLMSQIDNATLDNEKKEFLKLNLSYILLDIKQPLNYRDSLNNLANAFITHFPQSEYVSYTRRYIKYQFGPSNLGWGFDAGFGIRLNSGAISNTIDEGILFRFGMGVSYKKWDYDFHILVGPVQIQKNLPINGKIWAKGTDADYACYEFSVARNILNSKKHKLSPSLGIGYTEFSPYQDTIDKNPYYKDIKVDLTNISVGLNYQYKYPIRGRGPYSNLQLFYGCLNLRYVLSWQVTNDKLYKGFVNYITFSWGFEMHAVKRDL